jgi:DNA-binding transcriptional regulator YhcF (GntR family)
MSESWAIAAGIALDHAADVPLGVQLDWSVRAAIAAGRLRPGERLPGLRDVAEQLGVNHNTVRAAVAKLEADGVLETRHGAGTFVAAGADERERSGHRAALVGDVTRRAQDAGVEPRELATALYVTQPPVAAAQVATAETDGAARRRVLREELAVLDRIVGDLEARLSEPLPREPPTRRGPRVLSIEELGVERDVLVRRLAAVQRALDGESATGADAAVSTESETAAPPSAAPRARRPPRPGPAPA